MPERVHVVVRGRVQGVGFRYSAQARAVALGLTGWVRNCRDGSVEAEFEGPRPDLMEMLQWCGQGPPLAQVQEVDAVWSTSDTPYNTFDING
ncbi:MAG: acylphosphatase [Candidatus Hydrogenedentes bacterium]|nr:acylphosphatase [Candidatus Hydrogenedentota bacterium]